MNFFNVILEANGNVDQTYSTTQMITTIGMIIVMVAIMYFAVIRPNKKREKELKEKMDKLRVGDSIVTIGGIVGRVANIKDDEVTISTSLANTLITFQKTAISTVIKPEDEAAAKDKSASDKAKDKEKKTKFKVKDEDEE